MNPHERWQEAGNSDVDAGASFFTNLKRVLFGQKVEQKQGALLARNLPLADEVTELKATLVSLRRAYTGAERMRSDVSFIQAQIDDIESRIKALNGGTGWFG